MTRYLNPMTHPVSKHRQTMRKLKVAAIGLIMTVCSCRTYADRIDNGGDHMPTGLQWLIIVAMAIALLWQINNKKK